LSGSIIGVIFYPMSTLSTPSKVNGGAVRIVALLTVIVALVSAITGSPWPAAVLALDFAVRGLVTPRLSPLAAAARRLQPVSPFSGTPIFFAPKRFAARIGLILSAGGAAALFFGELTLGAVILGVLALFAFLEGAFDFCVACKIYGILIRMGIIPRENCPDCV
jgi:hypothetical protein